MSTYVAGPYGSALSEGLGPTQPERAAWERQQTQALVERVRLFDAPTLKQRIRAAIEHAEAHGQMHNALWPHQHFALELGELLRAAERGA